MSKKSPSERPYYLQYADPAWYRAPLLFPDGRDPRRDIFARTTVEGIARSVSRANSVEIGALQQELRDIALSFLTTALTTPLGMAGGPANKTHDERTRWLSAKIINPAKILFEALSDENSPMLSEWPETIESPPPDRVILRAELDKLIARAGAVFAGLDDRKGDGNSFGTEFRSELVDALTHVFEKYFPDLKPARDGYDKTALPKSPYTQFIQRCAKEIFPNGPAPSGRIIDEIAKASGNR